MPKKTRKKRWVIKAGSQLIQDGGPMLIRDWMRQLVFLKTLNIEVIWVTSGAIAMAKQLKKEIKLLSKTLNIVEKQSLSALGQPLIMSLYNQALMENGLMGAQLLICADDLRSSVRRKNFIQSMNQLLEWGHVPILNENDAVATEEIQFGDNDSLSAQVAEAMGADRLVLLTNVDGVLDQDPKVNPNAIRLKSLHNVPLSLKKQLQNSSRSRVGTGGMFSKVLAAQTMLKVKKEAWIACGDSPRILEKVSKDEDVGTRFVNLKKAKPKRTKK